MSGSWTSSAAGRPHASQADGPAGSSVTRDVAVRAVPGRDPVTPPQLPADVPVADLGQPVLPDLDEPVGQDPGAARPGGLQRRPGQRRRPDEPLGLEQRLDDVVRALAAPDDHLVRLGLDEVAARLEVGQDPGSRLEPVEAGVRTGGLGHPGGPSSMTVIAGRSCRFPVALSSGSWAGVILTAPGPELRLDDRVGDDRHGPIDERDRAPAGRRARRSAGRPDGPRRRRRRGSSRAGSWRPRSTPIGRTRPSGSRRW